MVIINCILIAIAVIAFLTGCLFHVSALFLTKQIVRLTNGLPELPLPWYARLAEWLAKQVKRLEV